MKTKVIHIPRIGVFGRFTLLLLLLASIASPLAFGDSIAPCQTGLLSSVENTSCTIDGLDFTFGKEVGFPLNTIFTPSPTTTGFTLTGNVLVDGTALDALQMSLQVNIATSTGSATIFGLNSAVVGTIGGAGGFIIANFFGCPSSPSLGGPCTLPVPAASIQGTPGIDILLRSGFGGPTTFSSATYEVTQVPEPSTLGLLGTGLVAVMGAARRKWLS